MNLELPEKWNHWDFNILNENNYDQLCVTVLQYFISLVSIELIGINKSDLLSYIQTIRRLYRQNHFHNFKHAVCVTHITYMLIKSSPSLKSLLTNSEIFAILLSALVHDVDHPGHTNEFEINAKTHTAIKYKNISVLENHHCFIALQKINESGLFLNVSIIDRNMINNMIIACIMATDMSLHFDLLDEFRDNKKGKTIGKMILHLADLSNPLRPFSISKSWAICLYKEFSDQIRLEEEMGLPISNHLKITSESDFYNKEIHFLKTYTEPLLDLFLDWNPYPELMCLRDNLKWNEQKWNSYL